MQKTYKTPSGGTYTRDVKEKTRAERNGDQIHHKAYSYTSKSGKVIHVPAHTEYARGTGKKTRASAPRVGGKIQHRGYSYTNSKGKTVNVAPHSENAKGGGRSVKAKSKKKTKIPKNLLL